MEMAEDHLSGAFGSGGMDSAALIRADDHASELGAKAHNYAMKGGFDSGSAAGLRLGAVNKAGSAPIGSKGEGKRAAQRAYEEAVLAALQNNTLPQFIAEQVFGDLSDTEIADIAATIEAETGKSLEENAKEILGEDAAKRLPGESLEDYRKRVITAMAAEMMNPDGTIKPKYANHPIAGMLKDNEHYLKAVAKKDELQARYEQEGETAELLHDTDVATQVSQAEADLIAHELESTKGKAIATGNQDGQTDATLTGDETVAASDAGFGALTGTLGLDTGELITEDSAMDQIDLTQDYNTASAQRPEDPAPAPSTGIHQKLDSLAT